MLSPCWGIPDVTYRFWWLQLRGWCPSVPVSCADFIRISYFSSILRENFSPIPEKFSLRILEKYGIRIKSAHDAGTEGQNQPRSSSHQNHSMSHRAYLNMNRSAQRCIDAGDNHLQHLLWWYILSAFGYCINPLTPNDPYSGRTAPLTSKRCILYIHSTNIGTEYFKRGIYSLFFLQNAVCFIIITYLVPVLFTFFIFNQ